MHEGYRENFFIELFKFVLLALVIVVPIRLWIAQPFIVSGDSMSPTFHTGQYLIIDELSYRFHEPARGDVIIFRYPLDPSEFFIKRVIGLPGETVHVTGDSVSIVTQSGSTVSLDEPYVKNIGNGVDETITLGTDQYFMLGDNRPDSSDSRYWGPITRSDIIGHAFVRLLPFSAFGIDPGSTTYLASSSVPAAVN